MCSEEPNHESMINHITVPRHSSSTHQNILIFTQQTYNPDYIFN